MRIKKNEEKKLEEKVKKDQKEVERRAEITKQRRKFDSTYVFSKTPFEKSSTMVKHNDGQPPLYEINQISTLYTTVTSALETLINKHKMTDIGNQNLLKTSEVKEDIKKEVNSYANIFNAAKILLDKVETANKFLSHMEEVEENENSRVKLQKILRVMFSILLLNWEIPMILGTKILWVILRMIFSKIRLPQQVQLLILIN